MRMWGSKHSNDAHVLYEDETKTKVVEIGFRIDASKDSADLVREICVLAEMRFYDGSLRDFASRWIHGAECH